MNATPLRSWHGLTERTRRVYIAACAHEALLAVHERHRSARHGLAGLRLNANLACVSNAAGFWLVRFKAGRVWSIRPVADSANLRQLVAESLEPRKTPTKLGRRPPPRRI